MQFEVIKTKNRLVHGAKRRTTSDLKQTISL